MGWYTLGENRWGTYGRELTLLSYNASEDELSDYRVARWKEYWDTSKSGFKAGQLNKVLERMKTSPYESYDRQKALACLWVPIHPDGNAQPCFEVSCGPNSDFDKVTVFSVSSYLRDLVSKGKRIISLNMPVLERRLSYVSEIFKIKRDIDEFLESD
jgi:hypothetical protein